MAATKTSTRPTRCSFAPTCCITATSRPRLATLQPDDLGIHLIRFDRALRTGDGDGAARILDDIRRVDGESGPSTSLARAHQMITVARAKKEPAQLKNDPKLAEALVLLEGV